MKIFYKNGSIYFENFGGLNLVLPDGTEGNIVLLTLQAAVNAATNKEPIDQTKLTDCNCHMPQVWGHEVSCPENGGGSK